MKYLKKFKLFENKSYPSDAIELLNTLDSEVIEKYWKENYYNPPDFEELLEYMGNDNLWNYVDDESFIKDFIIDETNNMVSDFDYQFDSEYDKENHLIPYIEDHIDNEREQYIRDKYIDNNYDKEDENDKEKIESVKNMGISDILTELDNDNLRNIIEEKYDIDDFCTKILEERYRGSSAQDIISEIYGGDDDTIFKENIFNIHNYMDDKKMAEDWGDNEDMDYIEESLSENIDNDPVLQQMIYEADPGPNSITLVEEELVSSEISSDYYFQKSYIDESIIKEEEENDEKIEDKPQFIFDKLKKYFIDNNIPIHENIIKEYDIVDLIEGNQFGFFGLNR